MQEFLKNETIAQRIETVIKERFAWPGGYALGLLTSDGECICSACAVRNAKNIRRDTLEDGFGPYCVVAAYVSDPDDDAGEWNENTATTCSECNRPITDATVQK